MPKNAKMVLKFGRKCTIGNRRYLSTYLVLYNSTLPSGKVYFGCIIDFLFIMYLLKKLCCLSEINAEFIIFLQKRLVDPFFCQKNRGGEPLPASF